MSKSAEHSRGPTESPPRPERQSFASMSTQVTTSDRASTITLPELDDPHSHHTPHHEAPPPYSNHLGRISDDGEDVGTHAAVAQDGRVNINIDQHTNRLATILRPALQRAPSRLYPDGPPPPYIPPSLGGSPDQIPPPSMNVVIHVVGSRGDVQPFVALGKVLKDTYGHRVRLATHPVFQQFVTENGLEFFSIGGDPAELMAFMVKNPGLMPGFDTLRSGDIGKRRKAIGEMIRGCWRSCFEAGDGTGVAVTDATVAEWMNTSNPDAMSPEAQEAAKSQPFVADCIIANPPSFAHIHCAERLGVPLHIMFTMPWSPTQMFPHPLANIQSSNADVSITNYMTYTLVDMLTWQGLGDVINQFRLHTLGLEPISLFWAPGMMSRLQVPHTYCWSPALIPKPTDWDAHISICGFYFLSLATNYTPAPDLAAFLEAGPPPVYIGFGSIVVDDPNAMTKMIFDAVRKTGQRALVSKGWGGLGADQLGIPEGVFMLGNVPHDWLFKKVSCVVHHGGAGTTAAGIACGRPTVIVPFFGDQPFWGAMVAKAGAGPEPIAYKDLDADKLAASINYALKPSSLDRAKELAIRISKEDGNQKGAQSFHQMLPIDDLRCSLLPSKPAVWRVKRTKIRLSAVAAYALASQEVISYDDLKLYRPMEWEADTGPPDPISGPAVALIGTISTMVGGVADLPVETLKALKIHPDASKSKKKGRKSTGDSTKSDDTITRPSTQSLASGSSMSTITSGTVLQSPVQSPMPQSPMPQSSMPFPSTSAPPADDASSVSDSLYAATVSTGSTRLEPTPSVTSVDSGSGRARSTTMKSDKTTDSGFLSIQSSEQRGRPSSMADALHSLSDGSRPRSPSQSPHPSSSSPHRKESKASKASSKAAQCSTAAAHYAPDPLDTIYGTGKGISKIVGVGLKSPLDFTMAVSKGFHNAPRIYGEDVRQVDRVTGVKSGLRTAGKEFGRGMFDGITGLFTQPIQGARKEGAAGFMKGFGRGIAGIVLKPAAGSYALPAYAMMGLYKEIQKHFGESVGSYIIAARVAQGYAEWAETDEATKRDIVHAWAACLSEVKGRRGFGRSNADSMGTVKQFVDKRKEKRRLKHLQGKEGAAYEAAVHADNALQERMSLEGVAPTRSMAAALGELAPDGNDSDAEIEEAIRLSLRAEQPQLGDVHDEELRRAITASLEQMRAVDEAEEDVELRRAIAESQRHMHAGEGEGGHDEDLHLALAESKKAQEQEENRRRDEETVMEYVRKQSLAEEEFKRRRDAGQIGAGESSAGPA